MGRVTSEGSRNNVSINRNWLLPEVSHFSLWALWKRSHSPPNLKVVGVLDNYSLVFVIFINFFGQLKDWVGQVLFLIGCPKGQVEKYFNVEACCRETLNRDIFFSGLIRTHMTQVHVGWVKENCYQNIYNY
jgi:hypothetical protein